MISYFTLTDNYIGITGLTTSSDSSSNTVPEHCTMFLFGAGLVGLAGLRKKFRAKL
jgi:hypothetical protein